MISTIIITILTPILTYLLIVLIKELIPLIRYQLYYKSQKIKYHYFPIFGWVALYTGKKSNQIEPFQKILSQKYKNEHLVAINEFNSTCLNFMLNSPEMVKEFFIKETEYTVKADIIGGGDRNNSFFWRNGKQAMAERAIFNKFFEPVNLVKIIPAIRKVIDKNFEDLKKKLKNEEKIEGKSKGKIFKKIDLEKHFDRTFSEIVDTILFGEDTKNSPKVDGDSISIAIQNLARLDYSSSYNSLLNLLTFMSLVGSKILPSNKKSRIMTEKIYKALKKMIDKRKIELKNGKKYGINMLDLMLKHNKDCKEEDKLSEKVMIANSVTFQIAGIDTSKNSTESILNLLSLNPKMKKKFIEKAVNSIKIKGKNFYESYEENEFLNSFVNEALRVFGPAVITFPRRVVKDMKLGGFKIKKGDKITIPIYALHNSEVYFSDFDEFKEERFEKGNLKGIKKNSYLPFSAGRRACVGRYLALVLVKMNVCALFDHFEIARGYETKRVSKFSFGVKECLVDLRIKDEE